MRQPKEEQAMREAVIVDIVDIMVSGGQGAASLFEVL